MTHIYESATVEPGGFDLDFSRYTIDCPACGKNATRRSWETAESGCIERYHSTFCEHCRHFETDYSEP